MADQARQEGAHPPSPSLQTGPRKDGAQGPNRKYNQTSMGVRGYEGGGGGVQRTAGRGDQCVGGPVRLQVEGPESGHPGVLSPLWLGNGQDLSN